MSAAKKPPRPPPKARAKSSSPAVGWDHLNLTIPEPTMVGLRQCAADVEFHGGATATLATVVRKALHAYLAGYRDWRRSHVISGTGEE